MATGEAQIKVGIGVMVLKGNKVLLTKRKGAHGSGEYAFPGGHLEFGESFIDCGIREVREEAGIEIKNVRFQLLSNIKDYSGKHYVHIGLIADWKSGTPAVLEPDKAEGWKWYDLTELPEPLFIPCKIAFDSLLSGQNFIDS